MNLEHDSAKPKEIKQDADSAAKQNLNLLDIWKNPGIVPHHELPKFGDENKSTQRFAEAYDFIQAEKIAKGLEKNPDLKPVDEDLKKMSTRELELIINMANYDLARDGSKLQLELKKGSMGDFNVYRTFDLELTENGKTIDHDKWRGKYMHGPVPPRDPKEREQMF